MSLPRPDHEIVVIGAGFSGIAAAIKLREQGFDEFIVVDEADGVGGTWHWNTYPGIAVDIPSFSYQYSFEPRTDWSRVYASGAELKRYAEECVDKHGVRGHFRLGCRIAAAAFDEEGLLWRIATAAGEEITARFLISATGALTQPRNPDIPGVEDFAGLVQHTARWDHGKSLDGMRVAVIGTGASAVQLIPAIAPDVEQLTVFQRTAIWCLPKPDREISGRFRFALQKVPGVRALTRALSQAYVEFTFPLVAHYDGLLHGAEKAERLARKLLAVQVDDPEVREKLTPDYPVGCKRPGFHNTYLKTFNRENVTLETDPIEAIEPDAVRTAAGNRYEIGALVLATGFKTFEPGGVPPYEIRGRGGVSIADWWMENRFQAYEGVSVPGFPNFFSVFGPYGYIGNSYFAMIETQLRHILRCLGRAREEGAAEIEVRREANDRYFRSMLARRKHQVFWQDGCSLANSYYFDPHGDVPLRVGTSLEVDWRSRRFDLDDYSFQRAGVAAGARAAA